MKLFKLIEVDLEAERARINRVQLNKRQRKALHKLVDLFEAGEWQKCLDHVNNDKAFPYNRKGEYPEAEHIGVEIENVLHNLSHYNFFTQDQLLAQAVEKLSRP